MFSGGIDAIRDGINPNFSNYIWENKNNPASEQIYCAEHKNRNFEHFTLILKNGLPVSE